MAHSGLIFDPAAGLSAPDTAEIRQGVAADWAQAFADPDLPPLDTEPTTPAGQLIDAETAEIEAMNAAVLFLANMFNPRVSEGRWQDALGYIYFLERKLDEPTVVTCQVTGLNGTVIPYGAVVQSSTGYNLICNRAVTIGPAGQAETTFRCAETGPLPFAPHSVNSIITVIPGWDSVDNAAAGAVGRDMETRAEFEARRHASVAANAHGGAAALFGAIANIPGVLDCQVLENIGPTPIVKYGVTVPGHGVTVCVYGGEDEAIAEAIYRKKANGADTGGNTRVVYSAADFHNAAYEYLILRPETINFWIRVKLGAGTFFTGALTEALKQALFNDFYGLNRESNSPRVGLAQTVFASRFYCPAMSVPGVRNIQEIEVALSEGPPPETAFADVVAINADQAPVISPANILIYASGA
jgi:uncharacterized phage protein gp47/JayE